MHPKNLMPAADWDKESMKYAICAFFHGSVCDRAAGICLLEGYWNFCLRRIVPGCGDGADSGGDHRRDFIWMDF